MSDDQKSGVPVPPGGHVGYANHFSDLDKDQVIAALVAMVHSAAANAPGEDRWILILNGAQERAAQIGLSKEALAEVFERMAGILEQSDRNNGWPKGFF